MAALPTVNWEVRADGANDQGGGFDGAASGIDYSKQAAPQLTVSDGTMDTTNATLTSVTGGFTAQMVGNYAGISQGGTFRGYWRITGWTSSNSVTVDSNGPVTAANHTIKVGGAVTLSSVGFGPQTTGKTGIGASAVLAPGQTVHVRAGTYNISSNDLIFSFSGTANNPFRVEGYNTTRGDIALDPTLQRPVINGSGALFALDVDGSYIMVRALEPHNNTSIQAALTFGTSSVHCRVENCLVQASAVSRAVTLGGTRNTFQRNVVIAGATASDGVYATGTGPHVVADNHIRTTVGNTFTGVVVDTSCIISGNIIRNFTYGVIDASATAAQALIEGNALYKNTFGLYLNNAVQGPQTLLVRRNIFSGNLTYDVRHNTADYSVLATYPNNDDAMAAAFDCNAFYTAGTRYSQESIGSNDLALTGDPFTDGDGGDFSLNTTSGAGALVRSTSCTTTYADGVNTATLHAGISGCPTVGGTASTGVDLMRSLWREYTNEQNTTVVPSATVDIYLQSGLEELNRRIRYHWTTGPVTLVAGTQEYSDLADLVAIEFVEWNGVSLKKADANQWRKSDVSENQWRTETTGEPQEYAFEGNRIILRPTPTAEAVARASTFTVRYISTPPSITTSGPEQLASQDYRIPVFYGVFQWAVAHPDTDLAAQRAQGFLQMFGDSADRIRQDYEDRRISR